MQLFMFIFPDVNINSAGGVNNPTSTSAKLNTSEDIKKETKQISIFSMFDDNKNASMEYSTDNNTKMHVNAWKNITGSINNLFSNITVVTNDKLQQVIKNSSSNMISNVSVQIENMWQNKVSNLTTAYNVEKIDVEYENGKITETGIQAKTDMQNQINVSTKNQLFDVVFNINNDLQAKYKELLSNEVKKIENNPEQQPTSDANDNSKIKIDGKEYIQNPDDPEMYVSDGKTYFYDGKNMHYVSISVDVVQNTSTHDKTVTLTNNDPQLQIENVEKSIRSISTGDLYAVYNDDGSTTVHKNDGSVIYHRGNLTGDNLKKDEPVSVDLFKASSQTDEQGIKLSNDKTKFNKNSDIDFVLDKVLSRTAKFDEKTQDKIEKLVENYLKIKEDVTTSELQSMLLNNGIDYRKLNTVQRWYQAE